jgi:hypothetical protein
MEQMHYLSMHDFLEQRKEKQKEDTIDTLQPVSMPLIIKEKEEEPLQRATFLSKLSNTPFNPRELVDDWILITYDIPATEEGNLARQKFLKLAPKLGAVMHTKSVYLMPRTNECELATVELSKIGKVYVWYSKAKDDKDKRELNNLYDARISEMLDELKVRLEKTQKHIKEDKDGIANRMMDRNEELFESIVFSVAQRGNKEIYNKLESIHNRLEQLKGEINC